MFPCSIPTMEAVCVPPRLIFPSGFFLVGRAFCLLPVWRAQCFSGWDACRAPWSVLGFVVAMTMHLPLALGLLSRPRQRGARGPGTSAQPPAESRFRSHHHALETAGLWAARGPARTVAVSPARFLLTGRKKPGHLLPSHGKRFLSHGLQNRVWDVVGWCPQGILAQLASLGEPVTSPTHFELIVYFFL